MVHSKYKFDPESLQFHVQDNSFRAKFFREYLGVIVAGILISIGLLLISSYIIVSPETRKMRRENKLIKQDFKEQIKRYSQTEQVLRDIEKRDDNIYKAVLESDPKELKSDTISTYLMLLKKTEEMSSLELAKFIEKQLDSLLVLMAMDEKEYRNFAKVFNSKSNMFNFIPSIQPVENNDLEIIIYGFGKRIDPFYKTLVEHKGLDFSVPEGTRVLSAAGGIVRFVGQLRGEGNIVVISHGFGFETKYSHLDQILVTAGKKVNRGDYIGTVGNSGKSMAPHLHYEVIVKGKSVNPVNFFFADLNASKYNKMIRLSSRGGISLD
jgi:murein DD-endopeptidase MepM/ murein hydrolase activator NlpD